MSDNFVNRMPIIPDRYSKTGLYPTSNLNLLGRSINNMEAGEGISLVRNVDNSYKISLAKPFHPFKIYGPVNTTTESTSCPSVRVYSGTWSRNGLKLESPKDNGVMYYTVEWPIMEYPNPDGTWCIYAGLWDSLVNIDNNNIGIWKVTKDQWDNILAPNDFTDRRMLLGVVTIEYGNVTSIVQHQFQDEDDIVIPLPFMVYDFSGKEDFATIKVRAGYWFANNNSYFPDPPSAYSELVISELGMIYIYIEFDGTNIEAIYSTKHLLNDDTVRRLIAYINISEYGGYRVINNDGETEGNNQLWTGDIYAGGGSSLPTPNNEHEVLTAVSNGGSLSWASGWVRFHA